MLRTRLRDVTSSHRKRTPGDTALALQDALTETYVRAMRMARVRSYERLQSELAVARRGVALGSPLDESLDIRRAQRAAHGAANAWLSKALGRGTGRTPELSLKVGAGTEIPGAFNDARIAAVESAPAVSTLKQMVKVWDATLDKRTCPVCLDADGTIVGIKESFPHGTPGGVHNLCRCVTFVVPLEWSGQLAA